MNTWRKNRAISYGKIGAKVEKLAMHLYSSKWGKKRPSAENGKSVEELHASYCFIMGEQPEKTAATVVY